MAAGNRSLLAFWLGGAAAPSSGGTQAGFRGLLAPWIGGASAPAPSGATPGFRSLLAFWIGGAVSGAQTTPPTPTPETFSGGWFDYPDDGARKRKLRELEQARKRLEVLDDRRLEVSTNLAEQRALSGGRRTHSLARAEKVAARRSHSIQLEQTRLLALIREQQEDDDAIALLLLALA